MTKIELLELLTKHAKKFRDDSGCYERNIHLYSIKDTPTQDVVDAVLAAFINSIGIMQGVDFALHASDLAEPEDATT